MQAITAEAEKRMKAGKVNPTQIIVEGRQELETAHRQRVKPESRTTHWPPLDTRVPKLTVAAIACECSFRR